MISSSWLKFYVYGFQDLTGLFSKVNIFGTATEKEWGRHVHVLMDGHVLFLKHTNKLLESKHFVNFTFFFSLVLVSRGFRDGLHVSQLTINAKWRQPPKDVSQKRCFLY